MGKWIRIVAVLLLGSAVHGNAAETVYVQSSRAKVLASPQFGSAVLATAHKGDLLPVLSEEKRWVKVRFDSAEGWVPSLVVGDRPPLERKSVLQEKGEPLEQRARRRASAATSAGAARGLMAETRQRSNGETEADYRALKEVESLHIPEAELQAFLEYLQSP